MFEIRKILYGTKLYEDTLILRNQVMRIPLGLSIYDEDLSFERDQFIYGSFDNEKLVGLVIFSLKNCICKVEYLCISHKCQRGGVGSLLLSYVEKIATQHNASEIVLDARVSASDFYLKHKFIQFGNEFVMDCAPVPHIIMKKSLVN